MKLAALCVLLCLSACTEQRATELTLAQLVAQQGHYTDRRIVVTGKLQSHADPLHYWIEDRDDNRVELIYSGTLLGQEGGRVTVRGLFNYHPERGRRIEVSTLEPADPG